MESNQKRVVITGMGVINAAGNDVKEFYDSLMYKNCGIEKCTLFNTEQLKSSYVGQIKKILNNRPYRLNDKTRLICIVEEVLKQAFYDSKLSKEYIQELDSECALLLGISVGLDEFRYEYAVNKKENQINQQLLRESQNYVFQNVRALTGIRGAFHINTSACSASATAAGEGFSLIRSGKVNTAIVIGADPLVEFSLYGFNSLKNISSKKCKPFDLNRDGITIGEGGAAIILEEYEHAVKRGAKIYCEMYGYGLGNDAYHSTSPDPTGEGALRCMKMAIHQAKIEKTAIDYVNAHGTGTKQNDSMELEALYKLFEDERHNVYMNSVKSITGHCLGAAGAIELVATVLSICNDVVFPNCNLEYADNPYDNIILPQKLIQKKIKYALSNSFAFAGNSTSLLLGKVR